MKATIDHIGIAVGDLSESLRFFQDALGLELDAPEEVPSHDSLVAFIHPSSTHGVLVELKQARARRER